MTIEDAMNNLKLIKRILVCYNKDEKGNRVADTKIGEAVAIAIEALEKSKWIPVSERLPEKGKQVLCCNQHGSVFTSAVTYTIKCEGKMRVWFGQHHGVVAWMPLPKPVESQESEDEK